MLHPEILSWNQEHNKFKTSDKTDNVFNQVYVYKLLNNYVYYKRKIFNLF